MTLIKLKHIILYIFIYIDFSNKTIVFIEKSFEKSIKF